MDTTTMHVRRPSRPIAIGAAASALVLAVAASAGATAPSPLVSFPSAQSIPAAGALPAGGSASIALNAARGEHEGAWVIVRGPGDVSAAVRGERLAPLTVELAWGHFVRVGGRLVPDALLPWDGRARAPEQPNQALYVRVAVPAEAPPGSYGGVVDVNRGGTTTSIPLSVRVFPYTLPDRSDSKRWLLTSFHVSAPTYLNTVARLYGFSSHAERRASHASLYRFLADYRISPSSWGFGEPRTTAGYERSAKWWQDSATNMKEAADSGFPAMRIPISSNRTAPANWIGGLNPSRPETWCAYLKNARGFWEQQGWLQRSLPFLYAQDEPDLRGQRLVAQQSKVLHDCWPGAKSIMTGNPSVENGFLSDGRGGDDLDVWVVQMRRFYGRWTAPAAPKNRSRELLSAISKVRKRSSLWSYTYGTDKGTPGLSATEPLSDPRMLLLWNSLEGLGGFLSGQGTTSYEAAINPFDALARDGEFVLLYPAKGVPVPSARLEQIRDGIEDWALLNEVRARRGAAAVRGVLARAGLFSTTAASTRLGCVVGCEIETPTKYSWPVWSRDGSTAGRVEAARLATLRLLG